MGGGSRGRTCPPPDRGLQQRRPEALQSQPPGRQGSAEVTGFPKEVLGAEAPEKWEGRLFHFHPDVPKGPGEVVGTGGEKQGKRMGESPIRTEPAG